MGTRTIGLIAGFFGCGQIEHRPGERLDAVGSNHDVGLEHVVLGHRLATIDEMCPTFQARRRCRLRDSLGSEMHASLLAGSIVRNINDPDAEVHGNGLGK